MLFVYFGQSFSCCDGLQLTLILRLAHNANETSNSSVSVVLRLEGPAFGHAHEFGLLVAHLGQGSAKIGQMERGHVFVDLLRQEVYLSAVLALLCVVHFNEGQHLGAGVHGHREAGHAAGWRERKMGPNEALSLCVRLSFMASISPFWQISHSPFAFCPILPLFPLVRPLSSLLQNEAQASTSSQEGKMEGWKWDRGYLSTGD